MKSFLGGVVVIYYCLNPMFAISQDAHEKAEQVINVPSKFLDHIRHKTADLDAQLTRQTEKYLQKMQRREARLQAKLSRLDPQAANNLFSGSAQRYANLADKMRTDTGNDRTSLSGEYQPYTDSLRGMLGFMRQGVPGSERAMHQLQTLETKMQDAD